MDGNVSQFPRKLILFSERFDTNLLQSLYEATLVFEKLLV